MRVTHSGGLVLAVLFAIAGCSGTQAPSPSQPPAAAAAAPVATAGDGRCHAEAAQFTVGQAATPALLDQARQRSGAQVGRVLRPNDAITMDYRSDRLSLYLDATAKVTRASCG